MYIDVMTCIGTWEPIFHRAFTKLKFYQQPISDQEGRTQICIVPDVVIFMVVADIHPSSASTTMQQEVSWHPSSGIPACNSWQSTPFFLSCMSNTSCTQLMHLELHHILTFPHSRLTVVSNSHYKTSPTSSHVTCPWPRLWIRCIEDLNSCMFRRTTYPLTP